MHGSSEVDGCCDLRRFARSLKCSSTRTFTPSASSRHNHEHAGIRVATMDYTFTRVDGGTLYENSLTVGVEKRG